MFSLNIVFFSRITQVNLRDTENKISLKIILVFLFVLSNLRIPVSTLDATFLYTNVY